MRVSVSDAKAQLTELVRRAEAGEEIVLTRHDRPVVRLEPVRPPVTVEKRRAALERLAKTMERSGPLEASERGPQPRFPLRR